MSEAIAGAFEVVDRGLVILALAGVDNPQGLRAPESGRRKQMSRLQQFCGRFGDDMAEAFEGCIRCRLGELREPVVLAGFDE